MGTATHHGCSLVPIHELGAGRDGTAMRTRVLRQVWLAAPCLAGIAVVASGWSPGVGWALIVIGGALFADELARSSRPDRSDTKPRRRSRAIASSRTRFRQAR